MTTIISIAVPKSMYTFPLPATCFDRLISAGASGHLYGQDEVLLLDGECPDVPNLEET